MGIKPLPAAGLQGALQSHLGAVQSWGSFYGGGASPAGGFNFSYDLNSDPGVIAARANFNRGLTELDSWLRNQRIGAFVDFGDPNLVIPGLNVDPNTAEMARQNYKAGNATLARLDRAHTINARNVINTLAAHGLINSGDLGYRQGEENQQYGNAVYDARKALLAQLNNDYQAYLSQKAALQAALDQAIQNSYANAFSFMFNG